MSTQHPSPHSCARSGQRGGLTAVPAVVYAAKSTDDPRGSIANQLRDCREAAEREGRDVVEGFVDEAKSAFKANRGPGLERAKAEAVCVRQRHGQAEPWVQHSDASPAATG
jgi:hypothetical protein